MSIKIAIADDYKIYRDGLKVGLSADENPDDDDDSCDKNAGERKQDEIASLSGLADAFIDRLKKL